MMMAYFVVDAPQEQANSFYFGQLYGLEASNYILD